MILKQFAAAQYHGKRIEIDPPETTLLTGIHSIKSLKEHQNTLQITNTIACRTK